MFDPFSITKPLDQSCSFFSEGRGRVFSWVEGIWHFITGQPLFLGWHLPKRITMKAITYSVTNSQVTWHNSTIGTWSFVSVHFLESPATVVLVQTLCANTVKTLQLSNCAEGGWFGFHWICPGSMGKIAHEYRLSDWRTRAVCQLGLG